MAFTNFNKPFPKPKGANGMGIKTVEMVMNRNFTVRSTLGHMITFEKGVPMPVPELMVRACGEHGATRVDGDDVFAPPPEAPRQKQAVDPGERLADVRAAIERIIERNDVNDFTAGNSPKTPAVSKEVGYKVDYTEVTRAWQQLNEEKVNDT
jgi:hypothetical protein